MRKHNEIHILRPHPPLGQVLNYIRPRFYRPPAFYMALNCCWVRGQVSSESEVEEESCFLAGIGVGVLD